MMFKNDTAGGGLGVGGGVSSVVGTDVGAAVGSGVVGAWEVAGGADALEAGGGAATCCYLVVEVGQLGLPGGLVNRRGRYAWARGRRTGGKREGEKG